MTDRVTLESLLDRNTNGEPCIPEKVLDDVWPTDDREPVAIIGKSVILPPTCTGVFVPCEEKYGREFCIKAIFDGPEIVPVPAVDLPASGFILALSLIVVALLVKGLKR